MTGYSPVSDDDGNSNTSQSIVWIIAASVSVITLSQLFHLLRENSARGQVDHKKKEIQRFLALPSWI